MKSLDNFVALFENNGGIISEKRWEREARIKKLQDAQGKTPEELSKAGNWAIDEPEDDDAMEDIDWANASENMQVLKEKMHAEEDFFIQGRAGWGKTSLIKKIAKKHGYSIITVYLDKCEAVDLEGNPVAEKTKSGHSVTVKALPAWANLMREHEEKDFLLFFDEMNQADGAVMNALMPIVLEHEISGVKFDNFFVGAAGNFDSENDAINELSKPLASRFKPLITWESGTDATWKEAFDYMHKKYDGEFGHDFVDLFWQQRNLFDNPREIDKKIFGFMSDTKKGGDASWMKPARYLKRLQGLKRDGDLSRTEEAELAKLAEAMYNKMNGKDEPKQTSKRGRNNEMVPENVVSAIKTGMRNGILTQREDENGNPVEKGGKVVSYGISRENIVAAITAGGEANAEMVERMINKFEADGITFKYEKDSEWKKAGLKDPFED